MKWFGMRDERRKNHRIMEAFLTLVEIGLGRDHYLIDGDIIEKFIPPLEAKVVYDAPSYIEGISPWKEEMIPSINVAPLLGMERADTGKKRTLIIRKGMIAETAMAVSVDEVYMVRRIPPKEIMPADISACKGIENYVKGLIRQVSRENGKEEELVLLYLNLHKMLLELLRGKIARPAPDFYIWRWDDNQSGKENGSFL